MTHPVSFNAKDYKHGNVVLAAIVDWLH